MSTIVIPRTAWDSASAAEAYFNERFPSDYSSMSANPNYAASGCGIAVTATSSTQTLEIPNPENMSESLCTMKYSTSGIEFVYPKGKMMNNIINIANGSEEKLNALSTMFDDIKYDVLKYYGGCVDGKIDDTTTTWSTIAYGNGKFVAMGIGKIATSTDGKNWTVTSNSNIVATPHLVYGERFVMVQEGGNHVLASTDGTTWSTATSLGNIYKGIAYNSTNGAYVLFKYDSATAGYIYTYTVADGVTFKIDYSVGFHAICDGGTVNTLAVAGDNKVFAFNATTGDAYTSYTVCDSGIKLMGICRDATSGRIVAIGYRTDTNGNNIAVAVYTDGGADLSTAVWYKNDMCGTGNYYNRVIKGGNYYIAVDGNSNNGTGRFALSSDAIIWREVDTPDPSEQLLEACYSPEALAFVAVGLNGKFEYIQLNADYAGGVKSTKTVSYQWSNADNITDVNPPVTSAYAIGSSVSVDTKFTNKSAYKVSDGYYVFSGWDVSETFNVYDDSIISGSWSEKKNMDVAVDLNSFVYAGLYTRYHRSVQVAYGNSMYVISIEGKIFYSINVNSWSQVSMNRLFYGVLFVDNQFVCFSTNLVAKSTDGINWNTYSTGNLLTKLPSDGSKSVYGNGIYCIWVGNTDYYNTIYYTSNINTSNWNKVELNSWYYMHIAHLVYGAGCFMLLLVDNWTSPNSSLLRSTDCQSWTFLSQSHGISNYSSLTGLMYLHDRFIVGGSNYSQLMIHYSFDGYTWNRWTINSPPQKELSGGFYASGKWYFIFMTNTNNSLMYTSNFSSWSSTTLPSSSVYVYCYTAGYFVFILGAGMSGASIYKYSLSPSIPSGIIFVN